MLRKNTYRPGWRRASSSTSVFFLIAPERLTRAGRFETERSGSREQSRVPARCAYNPFSAGAPTHTPRKFSSSPGAFIDGAFGRWLEAGDYANRPVTRSEIGRTGTKTIPGENAALPTSDSVHLEAPQS